MQQADIYWSSEERNIASSALSRAYEREITATVDCVRKMASDISQIEDVWKLHDFLSARRHDIDGKYDDRESFLMFTLSKLIKDKLLDLSDLEGLAADKRTKVSMLTRM